MTPITDSKPLSRLLTRQLLAYTAAAAAGFAACATAAQAEIVYTPAHNYIYGDFYLDLNHDGILDFHIHSYYGFLSGSLLVLPAVPSNKIAAVRQSCLVGSHDARPLPKGAVIGPGMQFGAHATCMARQQSADVWGPWPNEQNRYLGLAFYINGEEHYGWARLSVKPNFYYGPIARITGYACETIPNKPIIAGDEGESSQASVPPGTLGVLALGAPARDISRRREDFD